MRLLVLECAETEFLEAIDYHNAQSPGLGSEFTEEVDRAFAEILSFPNAWPLFSARARRHHTRRFEYGILYGVFDEEIVVAAIMHLKRDPQRWQGRVRATFGDAGAGASAAA